MEIIPSIDLKSGRCVRLFQGDFQRETVFSGDPVSVALRWQDQGAARLHLVDLDGAAQGTPANKAVISEILDSLSIPVQIGGGIRSVATAEALIKLGAGRVVIGTAAVENPDLVRTLCAVLGSEKRALVLILALALGLGLSALGLRRSDPGEALIFLLHGLLILLVVELLVGAARRARSTRSSKDRNEQARS